MKVISTDKYGRAVALVSCAGVDVNRAQVERCLAWVHTKYNQDPSLLALQAAAAAKRRGLWAESHPIPPWTFRRADCCRAWCTTSAWAAGRSIRSRSCKIGRAHWCAMGTRPTTPSSSLSDALKPDVSRMQDANSMS